MPHTAFQRRQLPLEQAVSRATSMGRMPHRNVMALLAVVVAIVEVSVVGVLGSTISSINGFPAPYIVGDVASGPFAHTVVACASGGATDCFISIQPSGTCESNVLTLSSYHVAVGTSAVLNLTKSSAAKGALYELCLHPSVATTSSTGARFYYVSLPRAGNVSGLAPALFNQTTRPYIVLPYQPRGSLSVSEFSAFRYNVVVPSAVAADQFPTAAQLTFALLPTCTFNQSIVDYMRQNTTSTWSAFVDGTVSGSGLAVSAELSYAQLFHLWEMVNAGIGSPTGDPAATNIVQGRLCAAIVGYRVNNTFTLQTTSLAAGAAFPIDLGIAVRLSSNFRLAGNRVYREEDTTALGASGTIHRMQLASGTAGISTLLFDHVSEASSSLSDITSSLAHDALSGAPYSLNISVDIRDASYPCAAYSLAALEALSPPTTNPRYLHVFASGVWSATTSLVAWDVHVNRTFLGNDGGYGNGPGGAAGILCLYVSGVPVQTLHLRGGVFTLLVEGPSSVMYVNSAYLAPSYGGSSLDPITLALASALSDTDAEISFNLSTAAPALTALRFTATPGYCTGLSSATTVVSIASVATRYLTMPGTSWFTGATLRRVCVAVVVNTSDPLPYYFQDMGVPLAVVVSAFGRIASSSASTAAVRFFVPLNAPTFALALRQFVGFASPYPSGRLSIAFASTDAGCLARTLGGSAITSLESIGTAGTASFGIAAAVGGQLATLLASFPTGTFASTDQGVVCVGDSVTVGSPASPLPLLTYGVGVTFYRLLVAAQSVSTAEAAMVASGTGRALLVVFVHPQDGLRIPITALVRTGTSASSWLLSSVLGPVRLSATGSSATATTGCTTGNGAGPALTLNTTWSSRDATDEVRVLGIATEAFATAQTTTGLRYLCFHGLQDTASAEEEALYSRTAFPLGIVSLSYVNGVDVRAGPNDTVIGVVQYVSFQWEVIGAGFTSASMLRMYIGSVRSDPFTIVNDTYALFSFRPQLSGTQAINISLGVTQQYTTHYLFTIDVVGVQSIGTYGTAFIALFAGFSTTETILLTSSVSILPRVCLGTSVDISTAQCTCAANVNVTLLSTTELFVDLTATDRTTFTGVFTICFQYNSVQYFTTKYEVYVVPSVATLGGAAALTGADADVELVQGTAPSIVVHLSAAVPATFSTALTIALYDADITATLGGAGNPCGVLSAVSGVSVAASAVMTIQLSSAAGQTQLEAAVPVAMTSKTVVSDTRLCAAIVLSSAIASSATTPLDRFVFDFQLAVAIGALGVNGIALNSGTNTTLPILSQANTTFNISLPSFVAASTFLQFGIASSSCEALAVSDNELGSSNQTVAVTNLTLTFPNGGGSTANLTIEAGLRSASNDVLFCARWLETERYTFTNVFLAVVYVSAFDQQTVTANPTTQVLTSPAGSGVMRNATRLISIEGERINSCCLRLALLSTSSASCFDASNVVFQGSIAQSTQQFSISSTTSFDYAAMCIVAFRSCTLREYPITIRYDAPLSILAFEAFDIDSTTLTKLNQQQSELMAIVGIPMVHTLYGHEAYDFTDVATLPFLYLSAQPSTNTTCHESNFEHEFPIAEVVDGGGLTTIGTTTSIPESPTSTTLTLCVRRNTSSTSQRILTLGMTLLVSKLTMGGSALGVGNTVSLTVNKAPELVVTGSNLNLLLLYFAVTDTGSCSGATLTGTNGIGMLRTPSTVVSCSSSKGSVTFTSATNETTSPLALCIGGVASSSGKATALSLIFYQANLSVAVTQALSLSVVTEPSTVASADGSLVTEPVLGIRGPDNTLIQNVPSGIIITASWVAVSPYVAVESICDLCKITTDGENFLLSSTASPALFSNAKFGVLYVLNYTSDRADIDYVATSTVERGPCPITQFGQLYSTQCEDCLASAFCDGGVDYTLRSSYWRANNKTNFIYDCSPPYGSSQCVGNTSTGTCTEGHSGPRCTICEPGYGKSFDVCVQCGSYAGALVTVIALVLAYIALVIFGTFSSVTGMDDERETKHLPILIKLLASHLAMASTVGEFSSQFPELLNDLFDGMRSSSRPSPQFASLDCSLSPTAYQSFLFLILIPIPTLFFVLGGSFFVRLLHQIRDKSHEKRIESVLSLRQSVNEERMKRALSNRAAASDSDVDSPTFSRTQEFPEGAAGAAETPGATLSRRVPENRAIEVGLPTFDEIPIATDAERELAEMEEDVNKYEKGQRTRLDTKTLFLLALVVVLLFGYPTIVEQSLNMLKCDTIEFGQTQPDLTFSSDERKLYFYDRSLDCTSSDHQLYTLLAYLSIVFYGIGIPVASIGLVKWFRIHRGEEYTNRLFVFLVCGYDEDRWWWETVVLWRKLALAFVLVFIDEQRLQTYAALWILMGALALQLWLEPYDEVNLDRLATASLAVVIVTLNLSLLYDYMPSESADASLRAGNVALTVFLFVINATLVAMLVVLVLLHAMMELQYQISTNAKVIRKVLPRPLQQCLFRFARRPIVMFHKILKKRERDRDRKQRIRHVINDAEGDLVDVVVMTGPGAAKGHSPATSSVSPGAASIKPKSPQWAALMSAVTLDQPAKMPDNHMLTPADHNTTMNCTMRQPVQDRHTVRALREVLKREEGFVRDLLEKYEAVVEELAALKLAQEAPSAEEEEEAKQQVTALQKEFERIMTMNTGNSTTTPPAEPLPLTVSPEGHTSHGVPHLVVEDLTVEASHSVIKGNGPRVVDTLDAWSPSAPSPPSVPKLYSHGIPSTNISSTRRPRLRAEVYAVDPESGDADAPQSPSVLGRIPPPPEDFSSFNDTRVVKLKTSQQDSGASPTALSAKARKRGERVLSHSSLIA